MAKSRDPRPITEAMVLKAVKQLLEARGFRVFRRNTGAVRAAYTSKRTGKTTQRFVRFSEPGMADLWGYFKAPEWNVGHNNGGQHLEVEIKLPGKYLTVAQQAWLAHCSAHGCIAFWCDSTDMAEAKLKEWGL